MARSNGNTVKDFAEFITSGSRGWAKFYSEQGARFLRIGNLTRRSISLDFRDTVFVDPPDSAEGQRTRVQPGDILVSVTADLGIIGFVDSSVGDAYVNQHIALVRLKDEQVNREWAARALASEFGQEQFRRLADHGAKAGLNLDNVLSLRLPTVSRPKQDAAVKVLRAVDEAIEATRAVIDQTRQLKTALLQDLLTNGLPGTQTESRSSKYIPAYPAHWELQSLGDLLAQPIRNGYSPISPQHPTGHWVTTLSAVSIDGYKQEGVKPAPLNNPDVAASLLNVGDIILSRSNTRALVGLAGVYDGVPAVCSHSDLLMKIRVDEDQILIEYALLWLLSKSIREYFSRTSRGTSGSMKKVDREIVENVPVPLPSIEEQTRIVAVSKALAKRLVSENRYLKQLVATKRALSQGLLTGRIPVKGVA